MVKQQQGPGGVGLETAGADLRLEVEHNPLVAEADAEVLKASVPASGVRQHVVELGAVHGGGVTGRSPQRGFAAPATMIVVEHPPVHDRVAQFDGARVLGAMFDVMVLAVNLSKRSGLAAIVVVADEHLDPFRKSEKSAVEVPHDPVLTSFGDAPGRLRCVVARVLAEEHDLGSMGLAA